jgi:hypothetical protein
VSLGESRRTGGIATCARTAVCLVLFVSGVALGLGVVAKPGLAQVAPAPPPPGPQPASAAPTSAASAPSASTGPASAASAAPTSSTGA